MTLENLVAIHKLVAQAPDKAGIARLLAAAARNLADVRLASVSNDNRFDAAYKSILQCAMIALWAKGFRGAIGSQRSDDSMVCRHPLTVFDFSCRERRVTRRMKSRTRQ